MYISGEDTGDRNENSVELYLRAKDDHRSYSINDALGECYASEGYNKNRSRPRARKDRSLLSDEIHGFRNEPTLSPDELSMGEVVTVYNPYSFFFRPSSWRRRFDKLNEDLEGYFASGNSCRLSAVQCGEPCLVQTSPESQVRRARINFVHESQCTVFYVDTGALENVHTYCVFQIPKTFMERTCMAVLCRCGRMAPLAAVPNGRPIESDWSPEAVASFRRSVSGRRVKLTPVSKRSQSAYIVNVSVADEGSRVFVNLTEQFLTEDPRLAMAAPAGINPRRSIPISIPEAVKHGWVEGEVTYRYHPEYFNWKFREWDAATGKLNELLKNFTGIALDKERQQPGTFCVAPYLDDDGSISFYRAVILSRNPAEKTCTVKFVDWGNDMECSDERLFDVTYSLMAIHRLSLRCTLSGIVSRLGTFCLQNPHN